MRAWLLKQQRAVAAAFAARAALRVLPILWEARDQVGQDDFFAAVVLPVFRATSVAWAAAKNPARVTEAAANAACDSARIVGVNIHRIAAGVITARTAALAAEAVFNEVVAATAAANAADVVARYIDPRTIAFWSAVSLDATSVEEGAAASDIADSPLWQRQQLHYQLGSQPVVELLKEQPDRLRSLWLELKAALIAANDRWDVWTDWYDDRLEGLVNDENHELAFVRIDEALWEQGPAVVNAEIRKRIEDRSAALAVTEAPDTAAFTGTVARKAPLAATAAAFAGDIVGTGALAATEAGGTADHPERFAEQMPPFEAIPEQEPVATRFGVNSQGLIDVVADPPAHGPAADVLQREYYAETHLKAQALVVLGPNQLGELSGPANRFREGLKDRIEDISITSIWSRGNTLRSRLKAHDLSMDSVEPDLARLPPLVAETLRDLVHTLNVFIVGDPKGRELDEIRLGPQDVEAAKQVVAAAAPIIEALQHSENVATPEAIEAVVEQTETAEAAPPGVDGDQAIGLARKTTGNFVSEILRSVYAPLRNESGFALKEIRAGAYRAAGAAVFAGVAGSVIVYRPEIISFVVNNADALKAFVTAAWHNPTLVEIIDLIVRGLPPGG